MQASSCFRIPCVRQLPAIFLFATLFFVVTDCHAQNHTGWLRRGARIQHGPRLLSRRFNPEQFQSRSAKVATSVGNENTTASVAARRYDPREWRDADADSRYPKFIGGFHSSHFSNIGLPTGDIGFRGNGIYWSPW